MVIGVVTALLGATTTPAHAVNVGTLLDDAARALPKVRPVEFRLPPVRLAPVELRGYGIADATVIAQLDNAKAGAVSTVESAVSAVGREADSTEVEDAAKGCVTESLKKVAKDYVEADRQGTTYPLFNTVFYFAIQGCIASAFPQAPQGAVDGVANYLTGRVSQPAQDAVTVAPTAFVNWLAATGDAIGAASVTPPGAGPVTPPLSAPPKDASFPWLLVALVAFGGGAAAAAYFRYRSSRQG